MPGVGVGLQWIFRYGRLSFLHLFVSDLILISFFTLIIDW